MILVDGQPATGIDAADRGLAYGDGLFETMRMEQGRILRLELHLRRLEHGCQRLQINVQLEQIRQELQTFAAKHQQGVAKLIVTRGSSERGYAYAPNQPARRILQYAKPVQWPSSNFSQGIKLFACQTRLSRQPLLAGIKHLNRLEQVLARAEWQDTDYAEGLMLDSDGLVTDGVFSNLFFVQDEVLHTPSLEHAGVAGVMRSTILQLAAQHGVAVQQRAISLSELAQMDEVFCTNSLYGVWPVRSFGQLVWPVGPLARKFQQLIAAQES